MLYQAYTASAATGPARNPSAPFTNGSDRFARRDLRTGCGAVHAAPKVLARERTIIA